MEDGWMDQKALVLILSRRCLPCPFRSHVAVAPSPSPPPCRHFATDLPRLPPDARPPSPLHFSPCTTHHRIDPGPEYHNILLLQLITGLIIFLSLSAITLIIWAQPPPPLRFFLPIHSRLASLSIYTFRKSRNHLSILFLHSTLRFHLCFFSSFVRTIYRYTPHSLPAQSIYPFCFASSLLSSPLPTLFSSSLQIIIIAHHHDIHFFFGCVFLLYFCSRTT
ncbi:hypothetical protein R3P38DRAFT_2835003, partial [Favolaschia claudopus]